MTATGGGVIFREAQKPAQAWLKALVVIMALGIWFAVVMMLFFDKPTEPSAAEKAILVVAWLLFGVGMPALFVLVRMVTEVRADGLYVRYIPFQRGFRKFAWADIRESKARRYDPMREYGGWGFKKGKGGRAINVSGDRGLQLVLKDGSRLLIGSQKADELAAAVAGAMGTTEERRVSS